ncbi:hypothetical protein JM946_09520 [Steroidobacter sp. S1-65]|uniref:Uncharacterized protein n=1 Tax=Steroidobacter gossypii TaxID=2805490 RepID=A0ABS1WVI5_9GAMM|nr:hypothetical protein [Steroidobacter gossypii]
MKHNDSQYDHDASLARIDAIAASALSSKLLVRYQADKQVLFARKRDDAAISPTLAPFVSDPAERSDRSASIFRCGSGP